jgi:tetratricopeptide (TPR) repeat protein
MEITQYENYEQALASHDFFGAIELLKQYVSQNPHAAMEWYWLGYALMRVHLYAEAGFYLRRALRELDTQTPLFAQTGEIYVTKASIYALLEEKDICLQHIYTALWLKPNLLDTLPQDITLQRILQEQDWKQIHAIQQIRYCQEQLTKHGWESLPRSTERNNAGKSVYNFNPYWELQLLYEPLVNHAVLYLQNRQDAEDRHIYHFRPLPDNQTWLSVLFQSQDNITTQNWSSLSESLIEVCESVVWEMPDGRRIKIG